MDIEKLKYLLNDVENEIDFSLYYLLADSPKCTHDSAFFLEQKIKSYIRVMTEIGEPPPYKTIRQYFKWSAYTPEEYVAFTNQRKKEMEKSKKRRCSQKNRTSCNELGGVLADRAEHICLFIEKVLNDSKEDPCYSAVSATNEIKCYIQIMTELGHKLPYQNVSEFFRYYGYTQEQYAAFEDSRKKESVYYRGVQY